VVLDLDHVFHTYPDPALQMNADLDPGIWIAKFSKYNFKRYFMEIISIFKLLGVHLML
jgi:hypothetical protein